jgi:hypothetical protein
MATIQPVAQPAYWRVTRGDETQDGITHLGELTGVAPDATIVTAEGETAFVTALAPVVATLPALPGAGWLEAGAVYQHGGAVVMVRQAHYRTEHDPATVPALFWTVNSSDAWIAGEWVAVGVLRTYGGKTWRCVQAHTTQADWTPPEVPALWVEVVEEPATAEWTAGVAYKTGDEVTYQGKLYRCLQAHTAIVTWLPPNVLALWLPI